MLLDSSRYSEGQNAHADSSTNAAEAHRQLLQDGFVSFSSLVSEKQVAVLVAKAAEMLSRPARPWSEYGPFAAKGQWGAMLIAEEGRNTVFFDFPGQCAELDSVVNELMGRDVIKSLLLRILGPGCRLWYAQIRRAEVGSKHLRIHQDRPGEIGLGILLSETRSLDGTTVFVKGSHRWPRLFNSFPLLSPHRIRRFLTAAAGSPGDGYIFYNCTWHGLISAMEEPRTAILMTFLPRTADVDKRQPNQSVLNSVPEKLYEALSGTGGESAAATTASDDLAAMGPDDIIAERANLRLISPWRLAVPVAKCVDLTMAVYRRLQRRD